MGFIMIRFRRKKSGVKYQYFEGERVISKTSYGKHIISYKVNKVFILDKWGKGDIEVNNCFKGVHFLTNEIEIL